MQVDIVSGQQNWYADLLKFIFTSNENVLTSHWTNKVAVGPLPHNVNHPASLPTAKLNTGKQTADIQRSHFPFHCETFSTKLQFEIYWKQLYYEWLYLDSFAANTRETFIFEQMAQKKEIWSEKKAK